MIDLSRPTTQVEFAALVGVTQQAVAELVRLHVLRPGETAGEWVHAYCTRLRTQAAGRLELPGIAEQRQRLLAAKAARAELELAKQQGRVVLAADVERAAKNLARAARDLVRAWPSRIAPIVAAESTPAACERLLATECDALVAQLSQLPGTIVRAGAATEA
ncbi:hypothetical protein FBR04_19220 [Betaproteobacteria bacterium PRO7]|nr:hypothetical protein [Betaproteobacteria bacterium PRO7]